jgi:hypothetical protein
MAATNKYKLHRRALMALNQLPEAEQTQLRERLAVLLEIPLAQWPKAWVNRLYADQPLYVMRISDSLRAIIQAEDGQQPELMDVVARETLESFAKVPANSDK